MKIYYSTILPGMLPSNPSGTMNAAVPMGRPRGGSVTNSKKPPWPPCLKEALKRGSFVESTIFMVRV